MRFKLLAKARKEEGRKRKESERAWEINDSRENAGLGVSPQVIGKRWIVEKR